MKWQNKLSKKELSHLRSMAGCLSLKQFKESRRKQKIMRLESEKDGIPPGIAEPCWTCNTIAKKLGIE